MSTFSSEEGSGMVGHSATSSGLESTTSLLFSVPSDASDVQTEITPPTSPALSEGKMRTPRDILDASRRLEQISVSALHVDVTPTKPPKQLCHQTPSESVADDEAGYDADRDGDGDGNVNENKVTGPRTGATATTLPIRRPGFLRIDTRQHRRVASMLAIRHPSPGFGFGDVDAHTDISHPPRAVLAPSSSIRLTSITTTTVTGGGGNAESYELRRRPRQKAEPVGLGIGFPENHPLRGRAFTMPVSMPTSVSPVDDSGPSMGLEEKAKAKAKERRSEWFPSPAWLKKSVQIAVCAPSPVRLAKLRPTFLEVSPSPTEYLPGAAGAGAVGAGPTFRCDVDVVDRSEVSEPDYGNRRTMGVFGCDTEMERKRYDALAREGQVDLDLSESAVTLTASSEVTMTFDVGSHSAWSPKRAP